jgi:hypothetical protein
VLRILQFVLAGLLGILALAWVLDWAVFAFPGNRRLYEDVRVDQVYTDTNKWHQVEYSRGTPVTVRCVNSLFPRGGNQPCWYLKKHTMNVTNTD